MPKFAPPHLIDEVKELAETASAALWDARHGYLDQEIAWGHCDDLQRAVDELAERYSRSFAGALIRPFNMRLNRRGDVLY